MNMFGIINPSNKLKCQFEYPDIFVGMYREQFKVDLLKLA